MDLRPPRHPSCVRLFDAFKDRGVELQASIARALNTSDQVVNNWKDRGVSQAGALDAQRAIGASATWILDGEGPVWIASAGAHVQPPRATPVAEMPVPGYAPELAQVLHHLAEHLRDAKPDARFSAAPLLARLAESPETAPRLIRALQSLLTHSMVETA